MVSAGANHLQLLRNIERADARVPDAIAAQLSPACCALLRALLQRNPVVRISFEEFFSHPFLGAATAPSSDARGGGGGGHSPSAPAEPPATLPRLRRHGRCSPMARCGDGRLRGRRRLRVESQGRLRCRPVSTRCLCRVLARRPSPQARPSTLATVTIPALLRSALRSPSIWLGLTHECESPQGEGGLHSA